MTRYAFGDPEYAFAELTNVSGAPGRDPGRGQVRNGPPASPPPGLRSNVTIDAEVGRRLDSYTQQSLVHAAHRAAQQRSADQRCPCPANYLAHVFGTNLRG